jgi:pimeloyl-ACP methyl ester carboxylesterase
LTYTVRTAGGRRLSTQVYGDPDGWPVFLLHGTPGSRKGPHPRAAVLHRLGVRLISFDRPGYGGSDRREGRRVADVADDVLAIAGAYGVERFSVVGRWRAARAGLRRAAAGAHGPGRRPGRPGPA